MWPAVCVRAHRSGRGGRAKGVGEVDQVVARERARRHHRHVPSADGAVHGRHRHRVGAPRVARHEQRGAAGEDIRLQHAAARCLLGRRLLEAERGSQHRARRGYQTLEAVLPQTWRDPQKHPRTRARPINAPNSCSASRAYPTPHDRTPQPMNKKAPKELPTLVSVETRLSLSGPSQTSSCGALPLARSLGASEGRSSPVCLSVGAQPARTPTPPHPPPRTSSFARMDVKLISLCTCMVPHATAPAPERYTGPHRRWQVLTI